MNKAEMIDALAQNAGLNKKEAETALNAVLDTIRQTLARGEKLQLVGFGSFETKQRAARKGRNPQTGEEIDIAAAVIPVFKPGKQLKEAVNTEN